jgi:hypothetical protein
MKSLSTTLPKILLALLAAVILLAACSADEEPNAPAESQEANSAQDQTTGPEPIPEPASTAVPPSATLATSTEMPVAAADTPETEVAEAETMEAGETATPEPAVEYYEAIAAGSTADFTASNDVAGIEGLVEVRSETEIVIRDFVSLVSAAPGVDIRLGVDGDVSDDVAVVLRDITGKDFEGRSLTLTIPDRAFDGRTYDTIAVMCWETGEIFDQVSFKRP